MKTIHIWVDECEEWQVEPNTCESIGEYVPAAIAEALLAACEAVLEAHEKGNAYLHIGVKEQLRAAIRQARGECE